MGMQCSAKTVYHKDVYYTELGDKDSIRIAIEKAIALAKNNHNENMEVLIVADDKDTLEYEIGLDQKYDDLKDKLFETTYIQKIPFTWCKSENIKDSFGGIVIAFYSDWDALIRSLESHAAGIIFIPGSEYMLDEVKALLKPIKL